MSAPALFNSMNMCPFLTKQNQCVLWIISSYFSTHNSKGQDDCGRDTRERKLGWNGKGAGGDDEGSYEILAKSLQDTDEALL